jgi:vitamin B12 transporter
MRFSRFLAVIFALSLTAFAADVTVRVIDPQSAAVAGAQVILFSNGAAATGHAVATTSPEGVAVFHNLPIGFYRVQVLAPGFAAQRIDVSPAEATTVKLAVAPTAETVVVTATRSPTPVETSGSQVDVLSGQQLTTMQPVAANDAIRFLPGAVIGTAGQLGGLSSLFVRGGDSTYNKVIVDGVTINEPGGTFDFGTLPLTDIDRLEFLRGTQSTLYGSDAMTSVVQMWSRTGSTQVPELRFGADGGNFSTANGSASLAGAHGIFDYNLFGSQFSTAGQGLNDGYSDSL